MFGGFNWYDTVTITEQQSYYEIGGINVKALEADLKTIFGTTVIAGRVIKKVTNTRFKFHKFFAVEMALVFDSIVNNQNKQKTRWLRNGIHKYNQILEELKNNSWIKTTYQKYAPYNVDKALEDFAFKPFPDQREFLDNYSNIKYGFQLKGVLLDAKPGAGKTFTGLVWSRMISKGKTIILVPKHLVNIPWVNHMHPKGTEYCFKKPPKYWTSLDKTDPLDSDAEFYIFYTENIRKEEWNGMSFDKIISKLSKGGKEPLKMIIDESHRYNEISSQQTLGMINFASHSAISDVLFSSGTPIKAQGRETYPLFCVIDPYFDKNVRQDFLKMYGRDNYFLNEMLAHRLGRIKFTISKIEGMGTPPEPVTIPVTFPGIEKFKLSYIRNEMVAYITDRIDFYRKNMPNYWYDFNEYLKRYELTIQGDKAAIEQLSQYRTIIDYFRKHGYNNFTDSDKSKYCKRVEKFIEAQLRGEDLKYFRHIAPAIKYVGLKIRGEALGNVLGKARIEAVKAVIAHAKLPELINSVVKKTGVYTTYVDAINYTNNYLIQEGFNPVMYYGETKDPIEKLIKVLREDKTVNPLITTFESLSEGTSLTMLNQLILLNSPWRNYQLTQTIARIYRKGQDAECFVWMVDLNTEGEDNITTRSIDIMEYYTKIVDQILGGGNGFESGIGVSTRAISETPTFDSLKPFDIPFVNFRAKTTDNSFASMFR